MQNQIIKQELTDNLSDSVVIVNPTKQQLAFFPKEESQMFTSKTIDHTGLPADGYFTDPANETVNNDTLAYVERVKIESPNANGDPSSDIDWKNYGTVPASTENIRGAYQYKLDSINASHTATDYIGSTTFEVPTILSDTFTQFKLYNVKTNTVTDFYPSDDTAAKAIKLLTGVQSIRIPKNIFNTILTDSAAIVANNNSPTLKNFGLYYIVVSPLYVRTTVGNITNRIHREYLDMQTGSTIVVDSNSNLAIDANVKRRTIYECANTDFKNLPWAFENGNRQSGRLFGSIVEVWDSSETTLKQQKVMTEDDFNFTGDTMQFVLYPDNVGFDAPQEAIGSGDVLRIYPRETYFNQFMIEMNYKDGTQDVASLVAFMVNDMSRDVTTGIVSIYDNNGLSIDPTDGSLQGTITQSYQVFQIDKYEARKRIKQSKIRWQK